MEQRFQNLKNLKKIFGSNCDVIIKLRAQYEWIRSYFNGPYRTFYNSKNATLDNKFFANFVEKNVLDKPLVVNLMKYDLLNELDNHFDPISTLIQLKKLHKKVNMRLNK